MREAMLENVMQLQHAFWDALGELEDELGVEIESTDDLAGMTVADLKRVGLKK
jgi:hypothetical protein